MSDNSSYVSPKYLIYLNIEDYQFDKRKIQNSFECKLDTLSLHKVSIEIPVFSYEDTLNLLFTTPQNELIGSISFILELFAEQRIIKRWITLFDPDDDNYDGDFLEDDHEVPRVLLNFRTQQIQNEQESEEQSKYIYMSNLNSQEKHNMFKQTISEAEMNHNDFNNYIYTSANEDNSKKNNMIPSQLQKRYAKQEETTFKELEKVKKDFESELYKIKQVTQDLTNERDMFLKSQMIQNPNITYENLLENQKIQILFKNNRINKQISQLIQQNTQEKTYNDQLSLLEKQIYSLRASVTTRDINIKDQGQKLKIMKKREEQLNIQIQAMNAVIKDLKSQNQELKQKYTEISDSLQCCERNNQNLTKLKGEVERDIKEKFNEQINSFDKEVRNLQEEIQKKQAKELDNDSKLKEYELKFKIQEKKIQELLMKESEDLQNLMEKQNSDEIEGEQFLLQKSTMLEQMKKNYELSINNLNCIIQSKDKLIYELNNQINITLKHEKEFSQQNLIHKLSNENNEKSEQQDILENEVIRHAQLLSEKQKKLNEIIYENNDLKEKNFNLQQKLNIAKSESLASKQLIEQKAKTLEAQVTELKQQIYQEQHEREFIKTNYERIYTDQINLKDIILQKDEEINKLNSLLNDIQYENSQILQQKESLEKFKQNYTQIKCKIDEIEVSNIELNKKNKIQDDSIMQMKLQKESLLKKYDEVQLKHEITINQMDKLATRAEELLNETKCLSDERDNWKLKYQKSIEEYEIKEQEYKKQLNEIKQTIITMQNNLDSVNIMTNKERAINFKLQEEIQRVDQQNKIIENQLIEDQRILYDLQSKEVGYQDEIKIFSQEITQKHTELLQIKKQIAILSEVNEELKHKSDKNIDIANQIVMKKQQEIDDLHIQIGSLENQIKENNNYSENKFIQIIDNYENKITQLNDQIKEAQLVCEEDKENLKKSLLIEKQKELNQFKKSVEKTENEEIRSIKIEFKQLQSNLECSENNLRQQRQLTSQQTIKEKEYQSTINELKDQLLKSELSFKEIQEKYEQIQQNYLKKINTLNLENQRNIEEIQEQCMDIQDKLNEQISQQNEQISQQNEQIETLNKQIIILNQKQQEQYNESLNIVDIYQQQIQQIDSDKQQQQKNMKVIEQELLETKQDSENQQNQIQQLVSEYQNIYEKYQSTLQQLDQVTKNYLESKDKLTSLSVNIENIQKERQSQLDNSKQLENQIQLKQQSIEQKSNELIQVKEMYENLNLKFKRQSEEITNVIQQCSFLNQRILEQENISNEQKQQEIQIQEQNQVYENKQNLSIQMINSLQIQIQESLKSNSILESDIQLQQKLNSNLQNQLKEQQLINQQLENNNKELTINNQSFENEIKEQLMVKQSLQTEKIELQNLNKSLESKIDQLVSINSNNVKQIQEQESQKNILIEQSQEQKNQLKLQIKQLSTEKQNLQDLISNLSLENQSINKQSGERTALQNEELQEKENQKLQLQQKLIQSQQEYKETTELLNKQLNISKQTIEQYQNQLNNLEQQLERKQQEIKTLENKIQKSDSNSQQLEINNKNTQQVFNNKLDLIEQEKQKAVQKNIDLLNQIEEFQIREKNLNNLLILKEKTNQDNIDQIKIINQQLVLCEIKLEESYHFEKQYKDRDDQLKQLKEQITNQKHQIQVLETEIQKKQTEIQNSSEISFQSLQKQREYENNIELNKKEFDLIKVQNYEYEKEIKQLKIQIDLFQQQNEQLRNEIQQYQLQIQQKEKELNEIIIQHNDYKFKLSQLLEDNSKLQNQLEVEKSSYLDVINQIQIKENDEKQKFVKIISDMEEERKVQQSEIAKNKILLDEIRLKDEESFKQKFKDETKRYTELMEKYLNLEEVNKKVQEKQIQDENLLKNMQEQEAYRNIQLNDLNKVVKEANALNKILANQVEEFQKENDEIIQKYDKKLSIEKELNEQLTSKIKVYNQQFHEQKQEQSQQHNQNYKKNEDDILLKQNETDLNNLEIKIQKLIQENQLLKNELEQVQIDRNVLNEEVELLNKMTLFQQKSNSDELTPSHREQLDEANRVKEELINLLQEKERELIEKEAELQVTRNSEEVLNKKIENLRNSSELKSKQHHQQQQIDNEEFEAIINKYSEEKRSLFSTINELEKTIEKLVKQNESLSAEVKQRNKEYFDACQQLNDFQNINNEKCQEAQIQHKEISHEDGKSYEIDEQITNEANQKLISFDQSNKNQFEVQLQDNQGDLQEKYKTLITELQSKDEYISKLNEKFSEQKQKYEGELEECKNINNQVILNLENDHNQRMNSLNSNHYKQINDLIQEKESFEDQFKQIQIEKNELITKHNYLKQNYNHLENENAEIKQILNEKQLQIQELTDQINLKINEIHILQDQLNNQEIRFNPSRQEFNENKDDENSLQTIGNQIKKSSLEYTDNASGYFDEERALPQQESFFEKHPAALAAIQASLSVTSRVLDSLSQEELIKCIQQLREELLEVEQQNKDKQVIIEELQIQLQVLRNQQNEIEFSIMQQQHQNNQIKNSSQQNNFHQSPSQIQYFLNPQTQQPISEFSITNFNSTSPIQITNTFELQENPFTDRLQDNFENTRGQKLLQIAKTEQNISKLQFQLEREINTINKLNEEIIILKKDIEELINQNEQLHRLNDENQIKYEQIVIQQDQLLRQIEDLNHENKKLKQLKQEKLQILKQKDLNQSLLPPPFEDIKNCTPKRQHNISSLQVTPNRNKNSNIKEIQQNLTPLLSYNGTPNNKVSQNISASKRSPSVKKQQKIDEKSGNKQPSYSFYDEIKYADVIEKHKEIIKDLQLKIKELQEENDQLKESLGKNLDELQLKNDEIQLKYEQKIQQYNSGYLAKYSHLIKENEELEQLYKSVTQQNEKVIQQNNQLKEYNRQLLDEIQREKQLSQEQIKNAQSLTAAATALIARTSPYQSPYKSQMQQINYVFQNNDVSDYIKNSNERSKSPIYNQNEHDPFENDSQYNTYINGSDKKNLNENMQSKKRISSLQINFQNENYIDIPKQDILTNSNNKKTNVMNLSKSETKLPPSGLKKNSASQIYSQSKGESYTERDMQNMNSQNNPLAIQQQSHHQSGSKSQRYEKPHYLQNYQAKNSLLQLKAIASRESPFK